jgi:hypothetical protein
MSELVHSGGWLGAALLLYAYWAVSRGRISGGGRQFQWCNVVGGLGLSVSALYAGALPSAVLNIIWIAVGLVSLLRLRGGEGPPPGGADVAAINRSMTSAR